MRLIPALLAALALSSKALAAPPLPAAVREVVKTMNAECRSAGGKPGASPGLVSTVDLNGDGRNDYVIHTAAFDCEGAASLSVGAGGDGSVEVFITTADGSAASAFEHGAQGMRVEQGKLWLAVGGPLCGQKVTEDTPRSAMQACWRPLQWDANRHKLDFAPLSSVRPYP
ncbi:hypothetical protein ACG04R_04960 [Roseateles sp. BYS78W]|uniref:Uncharacterized protein n=1 Tax=Pelomonas candidula TaxID=3299025 RepID=A0ABW7H865_9BURK